ncbi:MAG: ribonuclease HII [Defluviitaleaceae bacterium]|nr:ribonuclease HII [Defluviitaleaceae bacterium]
MTIDEIKRALAAAEDLPEVLERLKNDPRAGVQKLVKTHQKQHDKAVKEQDRLQTMLRFETMYDHFGLICGVDEAGAGPLAGPVAAGAVILPKGCVIEGLDDSKKLTAAKREELYETIRRRAVAYAVAFVDNNEIDKINILQARHKAMMLAVEQLTHTPDFILFDGNRVPATDIPHAGLVDGDGLSMSIAAASVLAKVERDAVMMEYHQMYPQYGFDRHKGYGTAEHMMAIRQHGLTPIHRRTFVR